MTRRLIQRLCVALLASTTCLACLQAQPNTDDLKRWKQQADRVTIIRDEWGIPHVYGKSDADAVFGLLFAQCEDDFPRVEMNYIEKLGRMAEVRGERFVAQDLLHRLLLDSVSAKRDYEMADPWMKALCTAFADGINYYLATHKTVKPLLLNRFEPWWPMLWTDGSIGAISTGGATTAELSNFYLPNQKTAVLTTQLTNDQTGSNGFAFAPKKTTSGKAILYINPHVTFYFRPEVHMVSEEGLNAYGAVTWGQFFIYQGFNDKCGWMHTSSNADVADLYQLDVNDTTEVKTYRYEKELRPFVSKNISLRAKKGSTEEVITVPVYYSHHGPVVARRGAQWISLRHHNRSADGLKQSWLRTKANSFASFKEVMALRQNTSNNTVYADAEGNIAYWHGNYMPRRDTALDWELPVDGSKKDNEWKGLHAPDETVQSINPPNGWLQNCNSTPFTVAGRFSPNAKNYPKYMAPDEENFRGINAVRLWDTATRLNIHTIPKLAYTRYLPAFELLIPALVKAWNNKGFVPDSLQKKMLQAVNMLRAWNYQSDTNSIATSVAIEWAEKLLPKINRTPVAVDSTNDIINRTKAFCANASPEELLYPLQVTLMDLGNRFGTWTVPWGYINRYQRLTGNIDEIYSDVRNSLPVPYASSAWGALPSYVSRPMPGTQRRYGVNGNSFICVVEFGDKVKARSLLAGGNNNNPATKAFSNQARMYTQGQFKDVYYYKADVLKHAMRTYKP